MRKIIQIKKADKIFPKYLRIRPHDIDNIIKKNIKKLSGREVIELKDLEKGFYEGIFGSDFDMIIERKRGKIKVQTF